MIFKRLVPLTPIWQLSCFLICMSAHFYRRHWPRRPRFSFFFRTSDRRSLQHFAHLGRKVNLDGDNQLLGSERRPAFNGLFVAALIATPFWVPLAFIVMRMR